MAIPARLATPGGFRPGGTARNCPPPARFPPAGAASRERRRSPVGRHARRPASHRRPRSSRGRAGQGPPSPACPLPHPRLRPQPPCRRAALYRESRPGPAPRSQERRGAARSNPESPRTPFASWRTSQARQAPSDSRPRRVAVRIRTPPRPDARPPARGSGTRKRSRAPCDRREPSDRRSATRPRPAAPCGRGTAERPRPAAPCGRGTAERSEERSASRPRPTPPLPAGRPGGTSPRPAPPRPPDAPRQEQSARTAPTA